MRGRDDTDAPSVAPAAEEDEALAALQAAMLAVLAEDLDAREAHARLHAAASAAHRDWIDRFEPRSIEVAQALVKKWGRR